jgi:cell division protein ZapA
MKVRITVRGQSYTVRSDEDDVDLREVAKYVDARMAEVSKSAATLDEYTVAMLAALNIASDFRRFQRSVDTELGGIERDLEGAMVLMESALPPAEDVSDEDTA